MRILQIGHGAIASYVADHLERLKDVDLACVLCRPGRERTVADLVGRQTAVVCSVTDIPADLDLALDCAGHEALAEHGPGLLAAGIDLVTVSVGALARDGLALELEAAAKRGGSRLVLLPGAVGGIDALAAARQGGLDTVVYRGLKPPAGWKGSAAEDVIDLAGMREATRHFQGSAREAALRYPKNANVAATIALAGLGLDRTDVELIADPAISRNVHEIEAEGAFGRLSLRLEGTPLPGAPRSSSLTGMSLVRAVMNRLNPVVL
ncbi:MAG: aspartate dehydrogenase [Pseudomonadota bacterium]